MTGFSASTYEAALRAALDVAEPAYVRATNSRADLPTTWNLSSLRGWRMFNGQYAEGQNVTFDVGLIADSYGALSTRYSQALADQLANAYADAGAGYIGFGYPVVGTSQVNGAGRWTTYPVTFSGAGWTSAYNGAVWGPDLSGVTATTLGNRVMVAFPAGTASLTLFTRSSSAAPGAFRYSYDNGATWTGITTNSPDGAMQFALATPPTSAFTFIVESNSTNLSGVAGVRHTNNAARGVRFNKLCGSGSRAEYFATDFAFSQYRTLVGLLQMKLVIISIGTNDQDHLNGTFATKAQYKGYIETIIKQLRVINPSIDILLAPPIENNRPSNPISMAEFQDANWELAQQYDTAFVLIQPSFGPVSNPSYYAWNGTFRVMDADLLHPFPATGGKIYADRLWQALRTGI